jgi:kynurenine 3-monooxygenase
MEKIVIIGAGPAGLLMAHYLLARGNYLVEIYDRRPDPRLAVQDAQRTFPISLQTRGLRAIQAIGGLEDALAEKGIWSHGACLHSKRGQPRMVDRKSPLLIIDRNQLTRTLLELLRQADQSANVTIRFDCPCVDLDPATQQVKLAPADGEAFAVHYDRLVAADGVRSQVRDALVNRGAMQCEKAVAPDAYKSLQVSRVSKDGTLKLAEDRIHSWTLGAGMRVVAAPERDGLLHGVVIFPKDCNPFEGMDTAEPVRDFFQHKSPTLAQLMTLEDAEAIRGCPVSLVNMVKCDRLHSGERILLIGDAAHAVSPSIGQGCNSSLQDVQVFMHLLEEQGGDWSSTLPAFTQKRLPDVHALRELSDYSFPRSKMLVVEFIFRLTLGKKLRRWWPERLKPLPMELVTEGDLSYGEVLRQTKGWVDRVKRSQPVLSS